MNGPGALEGRNVNVAKKDDDSEHERKGKKGKKKVQYSRKEGFPLAHLSE